MHMNWFRLAHRGSLLTSFAKWTQFYRIIYIITWFQVSVAVEMRSWVFWDFTQLRLVVCYQLFGITVRPIFKECLTLEDETNILSCNFHSSRSQWPRGLRRSSAAARLLRSWDWIPQGYGCLFVVSIVCCQVEVSATSWSHVQRSPTDCGASLYVI
jgi:hypothetical protein